MNKLKQTGAVSSVAIIAVVIVIGAVLAFAAINFNDSEEENQTNTNNTQQQDNSSASDTSTPAGEDEKDQSQEADKVFDLSMTNYEFSDETLNVSPGDVVTVNLTNNGGTHDFVIDELNVQAQVTTSGQTTSVTFEVPEIADGETYNFYCSIGNHRALGMEGDLVIAN